jgi:hypothetical protein
MEYLFMEKATKDMAVMMRITMRITMKKSMMGMMSMGKKKESSPPLTLKHSI